VRRAITTMRTPMIPTASGIANQIDILGSLLETRIPIGRETSDPRCSRIHGARQHPHARIKGKG
jgi:hypothetical protein